MSDNIVNISAQNDTVTVEKDVLANSVSVTNSNTAVNVTAPNDTLTINNQVGVNTVTINSQSDIVKLLSITEPKGDIVTVTEPESKVVTVTTPGPPGPPLASVTETDTAVTFNRDIKLDAGEHINLIEDQRIYFEADLQTWIESHVSDAFRVVAGGNQMLILDYDTGNRAVFGNGTKVYIGADNNALPSKELEVDGDMLIGDYIKHMGDEDTYIRFQANNLNLVSGGNSFIKCDKSTNKIQINNGNADLDMQVMADDGNVILHTDAGTNRVGVNTASPTVALEVAGAIKASSNLEIAGSQVDFTNLPTSDPGVAGRLYNDSNTLKISAG